MHPSAERIAQSLWRTARDSEQAVMVVLDDEMAAEVRHRVRQLAGDANVRIRTARMADMVVVVRLDTAIWGDDGATMRSKLSPPSHSPR